MAEQSVIQEDAANIARLTRGPSGVRKGPRWRRTFIRALERHGNVAQACRDAGISTALAYKIRDESSRFAKAWGISIDVAMERKEEELWAALRDRALYGYSVPVVYGGRVVGHYRKPCVRSIFLVLDAYSTKYSRKAAESLLAPVPPPAPESLMDTIRARALVNPELARVVAELDAYLATGQTPSGPAGGPQSE